MTRIIGIDWKDAFGGVHYAGRILASTFGGSAGGKLADASEAWEAQGGLLPDWARSASLPPVVTVSSPDAFVLVRQSGAIDQPVTGAASVAVTGGKRLDGDGRFSFGFDGVQRIDITMRNGATSAGTDIKTILFKGGTEAPKTSVKGGFIVGLLDVLGDLFSTGGDFNLQTPPPVYQLHTDSSGTFTMVGADTKRPVRAGFVIRKTARGRTFTALVPSRGLTVKQSVLNAKQVGQRAIQVAARIGSALRRLPTTVHGLTPQRQARRTLTKQQMQTLATKLAAAGKQLLAKGAKLDAQHAAIDARLKAGTMAVKTKQGMTGARAAAHLAPGLAASLAARRTGQLATRSPLAAQVAANRIAATRAQAFGAERDRLTREILGDAADDAAQAALEQQMNAAAGPRADGSWGGDQAPPADSYAADPGATTAAGPPDYGMGPPPTVAPPRDPADYTPGPDPAADQTVYDSTKMPLAGIVYYDGSRGLPRDKMGSHNRYYEGAGGAAGGSGYYWAGAPDNWVSRTSSDGGSYHDERDISVDDMLSHVTTIVREIPNAYTPGTQKIETYVGPLVGAPGDWTAGLRFDVGTRSWFWFWDQAPSWATAPMDLERLHQAQVDYETALTAAKTDYLSQVAQDKLDEEQSRTIARQQAQDDANAASAQQQIDTQQAQLDAQQAAMEQQWEQQQQALDAREMSAQLSYFEAHPEQMFAQADDGGGDEDYGDDGGMADGLLPSDYDDGGLPGDIESSLDAEAPARGREDRA